MGSGSSWRRRATRLALGAVKKIKAYSAEFQVTVGVIRFGFFGTRHGGTEKASKGAEKSFRGRRRRKRGLRKGKRRSRGRHPRRSVPPANVFKPSNRVVRHHDRMGQYAARISSLVWERVMELKDLSDLQRRGRDFRYVQKQYLLSKRRIERTGTRILANSYLGLGLVDYLEMKGVRIYPKKVKEGNEPVREQVVDSFLSLLRSNLIQPGAEPNPRLRTLPRRGGLTRRGRVRRPLGPLCVSCGEPRHGNPSPVTRVCGSCYNLKHGLPPPYRP